MNTTQVTDRVGRLRARVEEDDLEALVITGPGSIRWLTGYGGSNGLCIVTPTEQRFLTDFRYGAGVAHLRDSWDVQVVDQNLIGVLATEMPSLVGGARRVGFEASRLTYAHWASPRGCGARGLDLARADDEPRRGRPRAQVAG